MRSVLIALTFTWCGLVLGLSFIEAPLKFQAPDITRELGLGIGQLVFNALNRIEWFLSAAALMLLLAVKPTKWIIGLIAVVVVIVLVQTLVLLPVLDARIDLIRQGTEPEPSSAHYTYIAVEIIKLLCLPTAGWLLIRSAPRHAV